MSIPFNNNLILQLCLCAASIGWAFQAAAAPPNVVLIVADDMGYGDLGCYGHPVAKTPHLDRLAREGVRFTQHYANGPECSPTRTALLTGRYQQRAGGLECAIGTGNVGRYDDAIRLASQRRLGLPAAQAVIPKELVKAGYACGVFGKWHLGYEPRFNPMEHGWQSFFGYLGGNVHYFNHRELSDLHVLFRGRLPVHRDGYMTHLITDESLEFAERHREQPFFLYVAHECPHFPFQGPQDKRKQVDQDNWMTSDPATYVAMLQDLDAEVGRLLAGLEKLDLARETLVVFVSDNGGYAPAANMGPLRGAKGTTYEGGIRVPMIARWPGHLPAGAVSTQPSLTFDLTHSILRLAGVDTERLQLDGFDVVKHVAERRPDLARQLYWRGRRGERTWAAVRDGDLKYVRKIENNQTEQWLFDLSKDVGEEHDLASQSPQLLAKLRAQLVAWEDSVKPAR